MTANSIVAPPVYFTTLRPDFIAYFVAENWILIFHYSNWLLIEASSEFCIVFNYIYITYYDSVRWKSYKSVLLHASIIRIKYFIRWIHVLLSVLETKFMARKFVKHSKMNENKRIKQRAEELTWVRCQYLEAFAIGSVTWVDAAPNNISLWGCSCMKSKNAFTPTAALHCNQKNKNNDNNNKLEFQ